MQFLPLLITVIIRTSNSFVTYNYSDETTNLILNSNRHSTESSETPHVEEATTSFMDWFNNEYFKKTTTKIYNRRSYFGMNKLNKFCFKFAYKYY